MVQYVYVDILFLGNWLMNLLLLWATAKFVGISTRRSRMCLAAAIGAGYAVTVCIWPEIPLGHAVVKIIVLLAMIYACFGRLRPAAGARIVAYFLTFCFSVAGAATALVHAASAGGANPEWIPLLGGVGLSALGIRSVCARAARHYNLPATLHTEVTVDGQTVCFHSFVDTGNHLLDPVSGMPVLVCEKHAVMPLMPPPVSAVFKRGADGVCSVVCKESIGSWTTRLRVIPYASLGTPNGMLLGFKPDEVRLGREAAGMVSPNVIIGVCESKLSQDGAYSALVGPALTALLREAR